jgi:hypothetical protein
VPDVVQQGGCNDRFRCVRRDGEISALERVFQLGDGLARRGVHWSLIARSLPEREQTDDRIDDVVTASQRFHGTLLHTDHGERRPAR